MPDNNYSWEGSGTQEDPFLMSTKEQMEEFSKKVSGGTDFAGCYFKLGNNIDFGEVDWTVIGNDYNPFAGSFNGDGHTISNLFLSGKKTDSGLFGVTDTEAVIENLNIKGTMKTVQGDTAAGMVTGSNYGTVRNVSCEAKIVISILESDKKNYTGVLAGINQEGGIIENCTAKGTIDFELKIKQAVGEPLIFAGGAVGANYSAEGINECSLAATIDGSNIKRELLCIGGVAGENGIGSVLKKCIVSGKQKGKERIYGIAEQNQGAILQCISKPVLELIIEEPGSAIYGITGQKLEKDSGNVNQVETNLYFLKDELDCHISDIETINIFQPIPGKGLETRREEILSMEEKEDIVIMEGVPLILEEGTESSYGVISLLPGGNIIIKGDASLEADILVKEDDDNCQEKNIVSDEIDADIIVQVNRPQPASPGLSGADGGAGGRGYFGGDGGDGACGMPGKDGEDAKDGPVAVLVIHDLQSDIVIKNAGQKGADGGQGGRGGNGGQGGEAVPEENEMDLSGCTGRDGCGGNGGRGGDGGHGGDGGEVTVYYDTLNDSEIVAYNLPGLGGLAGKGGVPGEGRRSGEEGKEGKPGKDGKKGTTKINRITEEDRI